MDSMRLVRLGAMSAPRRRGTPKVAVIALVGLAAWLPVVLFLLWMQGVL